MKFYSVFIASMIFLFSVEAAAQTTEFTYQAQLQNASVPANGLFDLEFRLYTEALSGGLLGSPISRNGVSVAGGVFSVNLDFGAQFDGTPRYLEIRIRPAGSGSFNTLLPRQLISSTPYTVRSLTAQNATQAESAAVAINALDSTALDGLPGSSYLKTDGDGSGLTNLNAFRITTGVLGVPRGGTGLGSPGTNGNFLRSNGTTWISSGIQPTDVPGNLTNYVQNTTTPQSSSNFNISGTGTANLFNAALQYNIAGNRMLSATGTANTFLGTSAGANNSSGDFNTFVGRRAGGQNEIGSSNTYIGANSGQFGSTGNGNTFVGRDAGSENTTASSNTFVGSFAGSSNNAGTSNAFFGASAGLANISGSFNSIFGAFAGDANNTGQDNSFFGAAAGGANTSGYENAFFGRRSGEANIIGFYNSFFGAGAGAANITGVSNSFFGRGAGAANIGGEGNTFVGRDAGIANTNGDNNVIIGRFAGGGNVDGDGNIFIGRSSGAINVSGSNNTTIGDGADVLSTNLFNATAIGHRAVVAASNSLILGPVNGLNSCLPMFQCDTPNVGIGTTNPLSRLDVRGNVFVGLTETTDALGTNNLLVNNDGGDVRNSFRLDGSNNNFFIVARSGTGSAVGTGMVFRTAPAGGGELNRLIINPNGTVQILNLGTEGNTAMCRNAGNEFSVCVSSARFKRNIRDFGFGSQLVQQLRPVTFDWKTDGKPDLGLVAEEVAAAEPLLATYNEKGEVEGVKYDRVGVVMINAFKEQQSLINEQRQTIESQGRRLDEQAKTIEALRKAVCSISKELEVCR